MSSRREFLGPELLGMMLALPAAAAKGRVHLAMHQTTMAGAGFRRSIEACAKAGIRSVEIIPAHTDEFVAKEGVPAARRLLGDLGIKAVSSGGVRGLAEPNHGRPKAIEELKFRVHRLAELGVDRMVCPCGATAKYTPDDYDRGVENLREVGEIAKGAGVVAMVEFMRGSTFIGSLPTALEMTRKANHPNLKPMLDFYHFWAGLSKLDDLAMIRPGEIHHVHYQDVPRMPRELLDNSTRDIPGDGVAPVEEMLRRVVKVYQGPLSVELFYPRLQNGDPLAVSEEIRRKSEAVMRRAGVL